MSPTTEQAQGAQTMYGYNDPTPNTIKTRPHAYNGTTEEYVTLQLGQYSTHDFTLPLDDQADGGYPLVYYTSDSATLCGDCATQEIRDNAQPDAIVTSTIIGADVLSNAIDNGIVQCENCNKHIVDIDLDDEWYCECGRIHDIQNTQTCDCGNTLQRQTTIDSGQLELAL